MRVRAPGHRGAAGCHGPRRRTDPGCGGWRPQRPVAPDQGGRDRPRGRAARGARGDRDRCRAPGGERGRLVRVPHRGGSLDHPGGTGGPGARPRQRRSVSGGVRALSRRVRHPGAAEHPGGAAVMTTILPAGYVDLDAVRAQLGLDADGSTLNPIGLRYLRIGDGALDELPAITDAVRRTGDVVVLMDCTPMRHGSASLKPEVLELLGRDGRNVRPVTLGAPGAELHVDAGTIADATFGVAGAGCVVALGSGSICDIAKEATRPSAIPLVVVQTAN